MPPHLRIAIADDCQDQRDRVASSLREVVVRYKMDVVLELQNFSASSQLLEILKKSPETPPWDIVISDVVMPVVIRDADGNCQERDGIDDGGLLIATETMALYSPKTPPFPIVLITDKLVRYCYEEKISHVITRASGSWLHVLQKPEWNGEEDALWVLSQREWGRFLYHIIELRLDQGWDLCKRPEYLLQENFIYSNASTKIVNDIKLYCRDNKHLLVFLLHGEKYVGQQVFAETIYQHRKVRQENGAEPPSLAVIDCTRYRLNGAELLGNNDPPHGVWVSQDSPLITQTKAVQGLFFANFDMLDPKVAQQILLSLVNHSQSDAKNSHTLSFPWSENIHTLIFSVIDSKVFSDLLCDHQIRVPSLGERREDIVPAARFLFLEFLQKHRLIKKSDPPPPFLSNSVSAKEWLESPERIWPENFYSLKCLIEFVAEDGFRHKGVTISMLEHADKEMRLTSPGQYQLQKEISSTAESCENEMLEQCKKVLNGVCVYKHDTSAQKVFDKIMLLTFRYLIGIMNLTEGNSWCNFSFFERKENDRQPKESESPKRLF